MNLFLALGSNQGNRKQILLEALQALECMVGRICSFSDFYETPPWGFHSENKFLNAAVHIKTNKNIEDILALTQEIEKKLGRTGKSQNGIYKDRPIDIDILFYEDLCWDKDIILRDGRTQRLTIPHKHLHERDFVIKPLVEIAPLWEHPTMRCNILALWQKLNNKQKSGDI